MEAMGINKPVDRLNIKSEVIRNKQKSSKAKLRAIKDKDIKRKFNKDLERVDKLAHQATNEAEYYKKKNVRKVKAHNEEVDVQ